MEFPNVDVIFFDVLQESNFSKDSRGMFNQGWIEMELLDVRILVVAMVLRLVLDDV